MKHVALAFLILGACSSDDGGGGGVDAPVSGNKVTTVDCASSTPAATVTTTMKANPQDDTFMPAATTISVGDVVKFVLPAAHDVKPKTGVDAGLAVDFGETKCLKFTAAGSYGYLCQPHGFTGTITVN